MLDLRAVDRSQSALVGGKAARLGELTRIEGVRVPPGFCVPTTAFRQIMAGAPASADLLARLARVPAGDAETIATLSARLRAAIVASPLPAELAAAITRAHARLGERTPCAVRSSATAEDLPGASFAGQHDSYLDVVGQAAVLTHVRRCWASLFTDRAVSYRLRHGIDHRRVRMAVVVQRMAAADAAGVLFTADPVTGHRGHATVEAVAGPGAALVAGRARPALYTVRDGQVVAEAAAGPGAPRVLTAGQVSRLAELGRRIEAHFGSPQDVEWCLVDGEFQVVQTRPITTLFPLPAAPDGQFRVYLSVGHQQMMTDAMKPLGISVWQLTAMAPMLEAGGRLFVDATAQLAFPASRARLLEVAGRSDPLMRDALETVLARGVVVRAAPAATPGGPPAGDPAAAIPTDPAIVTGLIEASQASLAALRREIATKTGPELLEFLLVAFGEHKRVLSNPLSIQAIMAGMTATWWLDDHLREWLGEANAADALTLSAPGNITSQMGLELLDVADVIRRHPRVVAFLRDVDDDGFLAELPKVAGGSEARAALESYLDRYGMRCVGEIDITRPRWRERPTTLVPVLLDHVRNFAPGEAARRFERGRLAAQRTAREVLERLRALPDGERKAEQAARMIDRVRTFIGYREYPKYDIVSRYFIYKQALLGEAERLVRAGVLAEKEDVFYLTVAELDDVVRARRVDAGLIRARKDAFRSYQALTPPRVLTSDGEAIAGAYRREGIPAGALVGLPISAGTVEGRARVVLDMARADLAPGDILVTAHTDPSWTPLFVTVAGLVTEVGGLMSHGAVIAREYGLPAVVGVERATQLIPDGRRIRLHGSAGYVEILPSTGGH